MSIGKSRAVVFISKKPKKWHPKNNPTKHYLYLNDQGGFFAVQIEDLIDSVGERLRYYDHYAGRRLVATGTIKWPGSNLCPRIDIKDGSPPNGLEVCK